MCLWPIIYTINLIIHCFSFFYTIFSSTLENVKAYNHQTFNWHLFLLFCFVVFLLFIYLFVISVSVLCVNTYLILQNCIFEAVYINYFITIWKLLLIYFFSINQYELEASSIEFLFERPCLNNMWLFSRCLQNKW